MVLELAIWTTDDSSLKISMFVKGFAGPEMNRTLGLKISCHESRKKSVVFIVMIWQSSKHEGNFLKKLMLSQRVKTDSAPCS